MDEQNLNHCDCEENVATEEKPTNLHDLPLCKILELLIPKIQNGQELPTSLTTPPWRLPSSASEESVKINDILSKSMEMQSSKIPGSDDFDCFIISNSCLAISGLLKHYFMSMGLVSNAQVTFGILLWDANARDGPDDFEGIFLNNYLELTG